MDKKVNTNVVTSNTTRFAEYYLISSARLMDAIADPSKQAFGYAQTSAALALGAHHGNLERKLVENLTKMIAKAAGEHGYAAAA